MSGDPTARAALGARLDRLGIHDWRADCEGRGAQMWLTTDPDQPMPPGAPRTLCAASVDDQTLIRAVDALPRPALTCGHAAYLKRTLHAVHNALTPAVIGVSMTQALLGTQAIDPAELEEDLTDILGALEAGQARLGAITLLAEKRMTDVDPAEVLGFFDRPDSLLRGVTAAVLVFDLQEAPATRLQPSDLESWMLSITSALGVDQASTITVELSAHVTQQARACLRVQTSQPMPSVGLPALLSVARAAFARGADVCVSPGGIEIVLPPVRPTARANGHRALIAIAKPTLRARVNDALLADGFLTTDVALLPHAQAAFTRYGKPAVLVLDAGMSTAWGAESPTHLRVADRATAAGSVLGRAAHIISAFASPACVQGAAWRQASLD